MIKVENLCKSFGSTKVHNGINLEIKKGAITYIIGPSGTGKSVLLKQLMGLVKPDSGKIYVDGFDITTANKKQLLKVRYKFGMLFQNAALFDSFTIFDNVAFPLREHRKLSDDELQEIVIEKLRLVGLSGVNHKYPSELSGGMRKRVGLARAIALSPDIMNIYKFLKTYVSYYNTAPGKSQSLLLISPDDPSFRQIIGRHLDRNFIAR